MLRKHPLTLMQKSGDIPPFIVGICKDEWNLFFKVPFLQPPSTFSVAQVDLADAMRAQTEFSKIDDYTMMQLSKRLLEQLVKIEGNPKVLVQDLTK